MSLTWFLVCMCVLFLPPASPQLCRIQGSDQGQKQVQGQEGGCRRVLNSFLFPPSPFLILVTHLSGFSAFQMNYHNFFVLMFLPWNLSLESHLLSTEELALSDTLLCNRHNIVILFFYTVATFQINRWVVDFRWSITLIYSPFNSGVVHIVYICFLMLIVIMWPFFFSF